MKAYTLSSDAKPVLQRPDRSISALCHRGSHEYSQVNNRCKGRSCICDCHPQNKKTLFCVICESRVAGKDSQVCRYCSNTKLIRI